MAEKKIYDVRWEDQDGEQGYYVSLTKAEAVQVERFLNSAHVAGTIKNPEVDLIQGNRLLNRTQLIAAFNNRYVD